MSLLEALRQRSIVVADTGDLGAIRQFQPRDATTNPSIILKSVLSRPELLKHIGPVPRNDPRVLRAVDELLVTIGCEILEIIPGRVSTEVDAHLSFDTEATVARAQHLMALYEQRGIDRSRVLIKIAATWEGIRAAEVLEQQGIHCNMTLIFALEQAVACAEAGVTLISPFVGRILDWYQLHEPDQNEDPGVASVRQIYQYYKHFGYKTEVMAASFRNIDEITALAGCDLLTISPKFLQELSQMEGSLSDISKNTGALSKIHLTESEFRLRMNENAMATEKLSEGIRRFCADIRTLEDLVAKA